MIPQKRQHKRQHQGEALGVTQERRPPLPISHTGGKGGHLHGRVHYYSMKEPRGREGGEQVESLAPNIKERDLSRVAPYVPSVGMEELVGGGSKYLGIHRLRNHKAMKGESIPNSGGQHLFFKRGEGH